MLVHLTHFPACYSMQHLPIFPVGIADTGYGAPLCLLSLVSRYHKQTNIPVAKDAILAIMQIGDTFGIGRAPLSHCPALTVGGVLHRASVRAVFSLLGDDVRCGQSHATALRCRPGIFRFPAKKFHTLHLCGMTQGKVTSAVEPGMTYTHSKSARPRVLYVRIAIPAG
jgi:hypothetical protein